MTQKKLRLVRARLFGRCPVRLGAWHVDAGCTARRSARPLQSAAHGCGMRSPYAPQTRSPRLTT